MLTAARCSELLTYESDTGRLLWRTDRVSGLGKINVRAGDEAGSVNRNTGYRIVRIDGKNYRAHRVVWLMVHKKWPDDEIDHANGDRADNRISNLRDVNRFQNAKNLKRCSRNTSGYKGVSWNAIKRKWQVHIASDGTVHFLGYFDALDVARSVYETASARLHGEFMRVAS